MVPRLGRIAVAIAGSRTALRLAFFAGVTASVASCALTDSLPSLVTCDGVRALRVGMSKDEIRANVGPPRRRNPATECGMRVRAGECWSYESMEGIMGGIRFKMDIDDDRGLVQALMYERYSLSERPTTLFELREGVRLEGEGFSSRMSCRAAGPAHPGQ